MCECVCVSAGARVKFSVWVCVCVHVFAVLCYAVVYVCVCVCHCVRACVYSGVFIDLMVSELHVLFILFVPCCTRSNWSQFTAWRSAMPSDGICAIWYHNVGQWRHQHAIKYDVSFDYMIRWKTYLRGVLLIFISANTCFIVQFKIYLFRTTRATSSCMRFCFTNIHSRHVFSSFFTCREKITSFEPMACTTLYTHAV